MLTETELEQIEDEFLAMHSLEKEKYTLSLDTGNFVNLETLDQMSGAVIQKLMYSVAANTLDIILADKTMADYCASGNTYYTIEELLTPAQLDRLEANITTLDYTDPDTLETFHFAISLNITDAPKIKKWNLYPDIDGYLMVPLGAKNIEYVKSFIDYISEYYFYSFLCIFLFLSSYILKK